jgi:3-hydroxyisobutyrate dehydrogenase
MELSVGLVGLGPMGKALAGALIAAGHDVTVWDRDAEKVATTAMIGASTAVSAAQVATESDVVFTALPDPDAVLDVALGADIGILAGLREGGVLIDMTTATPDVAHTLDDAFSAAGRRFIDAPVSGKAPKMSILLGASRAEVDDDIVELLSDVASSIVYCGVRGGGYAAKLVNQHIKYAWYLASAEALLIAKRFGLDAKTAIDAVKASSGSTRGFDDAAAYFSNDSAAVSKHAPVSTIAKDVRLASELAGAVGVDSPSLAAVCEFFAEAEDSEYAHAPFPASIALLEALRIAAGSAVESTGRP